MNEKDFDLDFDFEKEYGVDLPKEDNALAINEEFDLESILAEDFGSEADFEGEYDTDFDYGPDPDVEEDAPAEEEAFSEDPEPISLEDLLIDDTDADEICTQPEESEYPREEEPEGPSLFAVMGDKAKAVAAAAGEKFRGLAAAIAAKKAAQAEKKASEAPAEAEVREQAPDRRRRNTSPMRRFKNETLPVIILGVTAVLMVVFICGSISRGITTAKLTKEAEIAASEAAHEAELQETAEAERLIKAARELAAGYHYEAAVDLLNTFTGSTVRHPEIDQAKADYTLAQSQLVAYEDVSAIPNLSFHVLVADPQRAYNDASYAASYRNNFVTVNEFRSILEQLYANDYILVDLDDVITETTTDGVTTYAFQTLMLPEGKKPVMITETLANYFSYMVDSDGDGEADAGGAGFASRLVVSGDDILAEYVDAQGNVLTGSYDLVPILEDFIADNPDFSYRGARATLAVTGYDGIFGYRINSEVIQSKGQEYYDAQVAGAQQVVEALREKGYTIACNTYRNKNYGDLSADQIQADLDNWEKDITAVIGAVDTLVFAQGSDIGDYTGSKFTVLQNEGFRRFITSGSNAVIQTAADYIRQVRIMVTGTQMVNAAANYAPYFDAGAVLDSAR